MTHDPSWHLLSNAFADRDNGLKLPRRLLSTNGGKGYAVPLNVQQELQVEDYALRIVNLDRDDPPGYNPTTEVPDPVPRGSTFNRNLYYVDATPRMPRIPVECRVRGFDPVKTPIHWCLRVRHVLCRHQKVRPAQYSGQCEILDDEWQGRSWDASFAIGGPDPDPNVRVDYNTVADHVMGGHALLMVAALPPGASEHLLDYVHLRIAGTEPSAADLDAFVGNVLARRNENIQRMVRAVLEGESGRRHFHDSAQAVRTMTFDSRWTGHRRGSGQPDCSVRFDFPDDPPRFPLVSFDFGVGMMQYTRLPGQPIGRELVWSWRENFKTGLNLLLRQKLLPTFDLVSRPTWIDWAMAAWALYNGSGDAAAAYARRLRASPQGATVSRDRIPPDLDLVKELSPIPVLRRADRPPPWPPLIDGVV